MKKDATVFLEHILESIEEIEKTTRRVTKRQFLRTVYVQDAVLRRLEVIGEAAKNVSPAFRVKHPSIPWRRIAGLRDVLIHQYFGVDLELVWEIVRNELPKLKKDIRGLL